LNFYDERLKEMEHIINNPVWNAYGLNTERLYPVRGEAAPPKGASAYEPATPADVRAHVGDPERDEINAEGRKVWTSVDPNFATNPQLRRGYDQLKEDGIDLVLKVPKKLR
jgi:hypothetical protein